MLKDEGRRTKDKGQYYALRILLGLLIAGVAIGQASLAETAELQKFLDARWIDDPADDGDSFLVEAGGKRLHIRLYFVDCPETSVSSAADAERVQEQTRYFGLTSPAHTVRFGQEIKAFVAEVLAKPFIVHTAFASAMGRSAGGRVYAFVTTAEGEDLATLLVKNGLARVQGVGRQSARGVPREETAAALRDLEAAAMLKRVGIWAQSDPEQLASLRTEQRKKNREWQDVKDQVTAEQRASAPLDLNTASDAQLQSITGIGPKLTARIIAGRPYKSVDELVKVQGIGPKTIERLRPYLTVTPK